MGSFHKDLGEFLVECSEDEEMADLDIIKVFISSCSNIILFFTKTN